MRMRVGLFVALSVMSLGSGAFARRPTGPPADAATCARARLANGGRFLNGTLRCAAKAAQGGGKLSKPCVRKAKAQFAKALKQVDRAGTCARGFEVTIALTQYAAFADDILSEIHPSRGKSTCDAAKLKATGAAAETLLPAVAQAKLDLQMAPLEATRTSTSSALQAAFADAEQASSCQSTGDEGTIWLTIQTVGGIAGTFIGQAQLAKTMAVPPDAQPDFVDNRSTLEAQGFTVATDGSSITGPSEGAGGWTAVVGDQRARIDANGGFLLNLPGDGPLEGQFFHPSDSTTPVARFFVVELAGAADPIPSPIELTLGTKGACGMNASATTDPPSCHSFTGASPLGRDATRAHGEPRLTPSQELFCSNLFEQGLFNPDPAQHAPLLTGDLGTYPNTDPAAFQCNCLDYNGYVQTGERGDSGIKGAISYPGSKCQMQVSVGCCDNEAATISRRILAVVDEYHFPVMHCPDNHKGNRFCQSVTKGDLAVRVKGQVAHDGDTLEFTLSPGENVGLTVHNNGCYGETGVSAGLFNDAGGVLTGDRFAGDVLKHYDVYSTYFTDSDLTYFSNADCPSPSASDKYDFEVDNAEATVIFHCTPTTTTTTTCPGFQFSCDTTTTTVPPALTSLAP